MSSTPPAASNPPEEPRSPGRGPTPGQILGAVAGFIVFAVIGATLGWNLTDVTPASAARPPAPSTSASSPPSATPSTEPSRTQPSTPPSTPANGQFLIPDYAAMGTSFVDARKDLAGHGIQGVLKFADSGDSPTVERTSPRAGSPGRRGETVKIYVAGAAPHLAVPPVPSDTKCSDWGSYLVSIGFRVAKYEGNRSAPVTAESPDQRDPTTVWNEEITLTCGDQTPPSQEPSSPPSEPATPSPSPSNTP